MLTPVFLDNLPDALPPIQRGSELYRLQRSRELIDLLAQDSVEWQERDCPSCGAKGRAQHFTLTPLAFHRCLGCNSIHAARVPDQARLDGLRMATLSDGRSDPSVHYAQRSFEFASILNWLQIAAARYRDKALRVLDYRFASHAPGFALAAAEDAAVEGREWHHVPLQAGGEPFADLAEALARTGPDAVLLQAEIDRAADPGLLLARLREGLPSGALVFVSSSCADGLEYEILGPRSPSFIPLDRLNLFSIRGFRQLAQDTGFTCLESSTPGRLDAVILKSHFDQRASNDTPFWSGFFRDANRDRLQDLQVLLQRSLRSGVMRFVLQVP
ncbi:hypothetical protein [Pseudogemmobacter sonorensis]|uniref:hypothetical protein n=1 Tax=Pseudogemmobacter sonorensis TaxID=2989681 RepID=UPI00369B49E6